MTDRALVKGRVRGPVLFLDEPLSFWGGLDPASGRVIDRHHPQLGLCLTGAIVVMEAGRGSSSGSHALAEAIRRGTGPAAIVLGEPDEIIVTGCLVAAELYGTTVPVLVATEGTIRTLESAIEVSIDVDGSISVE
jgi:predicted aconitase with swiveling domain